MDPLTRKGIPSFKLPNTRKERKWVEETRGRGLFLGQVCLFVQIGMGRPVEKNKKRKEARSQRVRQGCVEIRWVSDGVNKRFLTSGLISMRGSGRQAENHSKERGASPRFY